LFLTIRYVKISKYVSSDGPLAVSSV
jgi:hypothetical protein